jgi:hypothetical protein
MRSLVRTQAKASYGELSGGIGTVRLAPSRPHCANRGTQCSFPDSAVTIIRATEGRHP